MAVFYKFKSARDFDSIPMDGPFISVCTLKENIFESKNLGRGTDFDLVITNAQTNEEYLDEMLIRKNTSVLVRRIPGRLSLPIVTGPQQKVGHKMLKTEPENDKLPAVDTSTIKYPEDLDWDDFGNDLYSIPDQVPVQLNNLVPEAPPTSVTDENSKIKASIDTQALDWQSQGSNFGDTRSFGRDKGRWTGASGGFGFVWKRPPEGYVCHRCNEPGHLIQHCPTNGDPNYEIKRVKQPIGVPKSMQMENPQGSYALANGSVAVLQPNEAAFEKEREGIPSRRSVGDVAPEFFCPLCQQVLKDAVLTSKCCFNSFCDKCIRDYILSKSMCVCGTKDVLADDLLPNKTLRDVVNRILESGNSSFEKGASTFQEVQSSLFPMPKITSPTSSAAPNGEQKFSPINEGTTNIQETIDDKKAISAPRKKSEQVMIPKVVDVSKAAHESMNEPASKGCAQQFKEGVKLVLVEEDFHRETPQDLGAENYMMPMNPPSDYNSYWNCMQPYTDGYMQPYADPMQMMGYGVGPMDMVFASGVPEDPFGMQGYMMSVVPPHRDVADFNMGVNVPVHPSALTREEFEARKADLRRKRENETRGERALFKNEDIGRDCHYEPERQHRHRSHGSSIISSSTTANIKHKPSSVSFPAENEPSKKRKVTFFFDNGDNRHMSQHQGN